MSRGTASIRSGTRRVFIALFTLHKVRPRAFPIGCFGFLATPPLRPYPMLHSHFILSSLSPTSVLRHLYHSINYSPRLRRFRSQMRAVPSRSNPRATRLTTLKSRSCRVGSGMVRRDEAKHRVDLRCVTHWSTGTTNVRAFRAQESTLSG